MERENKKLKKISIILLLIITYFIIFFLQANLFQSFTIAGVMPNLFVIYILFIGLSANVTTRRFVWRNRWFNY